MIQALPLKCCVTCGKSCNFSGPQFLVLKNQQDRTDNAEVCTWSDILIYLQMISGSDSQLYIHHDIQRVNIPKLILAYFGKYSRPSSWFVFLIVKPKVKVQDSSTATNISKRTDPFVANNLERPMEVPL